MSLERQINDYIAEGNPNTLDPKPRINFDRLALERAEAEGMNERDAEKPLTEGVEQQIVALVAVKSPQLQPVS